MSTVFRDWSPRRPRTAFVCCPEPTCQQEYPRDVLQAVGPAKCGRCGERFVLRNGAGVVRLETPIIHPPPVRTVSDPEADIRKRFVRARDAHGSVSTSLRTSETEKDEWREAAERAGMSFNGWVRRALGEAVDLDKANTAHPAHEPASRATPDPKELI